MVTEHEEPIAEAIGPWNELTNLALERACTHSASPVEQRSGGV
jgi:hypothetical protein